MASDEGQSDRVSTESADAADGRQDTGASGVEADLSRKSAPAALTVKGCDSFSTPRGKKKGESLGSFFKLPAGEVCNYVF